MISGPMIWNSYAHGLARSAIMWGLAAIAAGQADQHQATFCILVLIAIDVCSISQTKFTAFVAELILEKMSQTHLSLRLFCDSAVEALRVGKGSEVNVMQLFSASSKEAEKITLQEKAEADLGRAAKFFLAAWVFVWRIFGTALFYGSASVVGSSFH